MSKKSKHHKPKGPKNPPQNSPTKETPELNPTETPATRVPESPKISEVTAVTAVISELKQVVEKIEKNSSTANPETPVVVQTPVKPKRNRGNRNKKKNTDGNTQDEGNEIKEDISPDEVIEEKVKPKDEVKSKEEILTKDEVKPPQSIEQKEEVFPKVEQSGKKGKNKKGGGLKPEEINQEKLVEKISDVAVDKKCDAQTQIKKKLQKDVKTEEKVATSDVIIITEEIASKPDSASDPPEKNKRGKNKKKGNKSESVEQILPNAEEEIKNFSGKVFLSDRIPRDEIKIVTCERILLDDEIKKPVRESKDEQKKEDKQEQKNKKDKKNNDKPIAPASSVIQSQIDIESPLCDPLVYSKKCEESDVKKDISRSEENIAMKNILITDVSAVKREISKSEESVVQKEAKCQENPINKPLTKADVVDDLFPSLATSIEETLQKLIVCESDMKIAEQLFAGDNKDELKKSTSDIKEFISACVKDFKPAQKESTPNKQPITKDKGKSKDKKSKKSERQPESLQTPELNVVSDILEQLIKPIDKKAQEKYTEDMLAIPETTQLIMDLQKESSPGRTFTEQLLDISSKTCRTDPSHIETKPKDVIRMGSPAARTASPSSCVLSTKESSPGIREAFFKPILGDSSVIKDAPGGINLCTLGIKPADPRKTPSPTIREQLFQPITGAISDNLQTHFTKIDKDPSPNRSLLEKFDKRDTSPSKCLLEKARLEDEKSNEKVDDKHVFLQTASSPTKDIHKESSPGRSLREALFHRNISEEKPEILKTIVSPPVHLESCAIKTPISEDIVNLLLSDITPACITSGLRLSKSKSRDDIKDSKSPAKEVKDTKSLVKDSKSPAKEITDSTPAVKDWEDSKYPTKEIKDTKFEEKDVKDSKSPAKEIKDKKSPVKECIVLLETESSRVGEKSEKNKKNKSKNQEKQKPVTSVITLPPLSQVIEKAETQAEEVACKKEDASEPLEIITEQLIETPVKQDQDILVDTPKAAKRAKDKKSKNRGNDIISEGDIVIIEAETPCTSIIEEIKPVVVDNTVKDDAKCKKTDEKVSMDDTKSKKTEQQAKEIGDIPMLIEGCSKEDFQVVKPENVTNVQSSPMKVAPDTADSIFEFLKLPNRGEKTGSEELLQEDTRKEGNIPQPKPHSNQSKNWFGPSSTPAKSSKPDYKKEKDKDPKYVISETECPIVIPVDDLKDTSLSKIVGGAMKKDNKHKVKDPKTLDKKDNKSKGKAEAAKAGSSSNIAMIDDVDEEFVYKYSFRTVFIPNACHICKVQLKEDRVVCRFCHLVSYCNEDHRDEDWQSHQSLCYAICTLSHVKAAEHIYGDARALSGQDYRLLRMQAIVSCEKILKRKLCPWEQEVLLYPRICCDASCREWRSKNLKDCELCGQVSYCTNNMTHLPADHSTWCQSYRLYHRLVSHQLHQGRIEPDLPSKIFPEGYILPDVCSKLFDDLYGSIKDMNDCHYATLSQLSTAPLTALYAYQKTVGARDAAQPVTKDTLCVHIIGAELQFEADTLSKWESFFLHLTSGIKELRIVFVGPELNSSKLPVDLLSRVRMCPSCRTSNRTVKFEFHDEILYHDFVESSKFSKPDLICAFNPGFHRATGYAGLDTWPDTILASLRLKVPLCVTAYTQYEMPRDLARIKSVFAEVQVKIEPAKNPYASLRPDRNFISDDEMPLIFKNYQMMVVSAI